MPRLGLYVLYFFSNVHYYDFLGIGIDLQAGHFLYKFQKGGRKRAIEVVSTAYQQRRRYQKLEFDFPLIDKGTKDW